MLQRGDEALLRVAQGHGAEGSRALSPRDVAERLRSAPRDEEGKKGGIPLMREIGTRRIGLIPPRTLPCPFQRKQQGEGRTRFSLCEAGEETAGHGGSD